MAKRRTLTWKALSNGEAAQVLDTSYLGGCTHILCMMIDIRRRDIDLGVPVKKLLEIEKTRFFPNTKLKIRTPHWYLDRWGVLLVITYKRDE